MIRRIRHLPAWAKATAVAVCAVVALVGALGAASVFAVHPEEPVSSLGVVDDAVASQDVAEEPEASLDPAAAAAARTALDAAPATADVGLFEVGGGQRTVGSADIPDVAAALAAFRAAGYEAGFVVYDFAAERGLAANADAVRFSASTVKAPYVAYVAQSIVDGGQASLADEVVEDRVEEGTGIMASDAEDRYDLGTVLANTIVHSDNTGYALLRENYDGAFEAWAAAAGVDAFAWGGEWYPSFTPRDLAKLWLSVGAYLEAGNGQAPYLEDLLSRTGTSFMREALGAEREVLSKPGYEIDMPGYSTAALNDAGIVRGGQGDYLMVVMSNANYDDAYLTDTEPLILDLITALDAAHDQLLAA